MEKTATQLAFNMYIYKENVLRNSINDLFAMFDYKVTTELQKQIVDAFKILHFIMIRMSFLDIYRTRNDLSVQKTFEKYHKDRKGRKYRNKKKK